jgi:prolyl oligopeptidase
VRSLPLLVLLAALAGPAAPAQPTSDAPFLWLEEVESPQALAWVEAQNAETLARLRAHPAFDEVYERALAILTSDDRIPFPSIIGDRVYNFWQDAEHPRGLWRRTSWEGYLSGNPSWQTVLDVGALGEAEEVNWAFAGARCLAPDYRLCLVSLSRGGADAAEVREFDLEAGEFILDGFYLPEAKSQVAWVTEDTLLVATDFGEGSLTTSGYARVAKLWARGTPLDEARTLFEGAPGDVRVGVGTLRSGDRSYPLVIHRPSFFEGTTHVLVGDELLRLELPMDASPSLVGDRLVVYLRSDWRLGERTFPQGAVIASGIEAFLAGSPAFEVVFAPTEREVVRRVATTRNYLLVNKLSNVRGELHRYRYEGGRWVGERVPAGEMGSVASGATSEDHDRFFFTYTSYLQPTTLYVAEADGSTRVVRESPAMFDAAGLTVAQYEATSADGTTVPYFVVHREGMALDGSHPTQLYAYGGFEVAQTPSYTPLVGAAWLERGGVYVLANIRGGGEFGPAWHRAAMREHRQRAFDDFIAVAEDLIDRGITSPERLGIRGGSNGGLLVGAALTQRPDLFGAAVSAVPLLDMQRYHLLLAGASWMAEYGDPDDPADWAFIQRYSPYHNLREDAAYPPTLFTTTTRDDRVHPGHARKMAARMEAMGHDVYYFENTEGGHGSGTTPEQQALSWAVTYTYLLKQLADAPPQP